MVDSKKCPFCSEQIKVTAIKCRYCGEWLDNISVLPGKASDGLPDSGNMQQGDSKGGTHTVQHQSGNSHYSDTPPGWVNQDRSHFSSKPANISPSGSAQNNMSHNQSSLTGIQLARQALGNRYEIIEEIGRGGMATVYKALQRSLNRFVALKVVHQNLLHDTEFLARFHREAELCASLNHPNIVTVFDEGEVSGVHFMVMEYLEGTDLHKLIRSRGRLTPVQTLQYLLPVAESLDYAHGKGYIHRDIKSANIFITIHGRVVLMDFGIAHAASGTQLTQAGSVIGTPEYMSPEQAEGRKVDHRTDIYSLGVVMYECLTGNVPFKGEQPVATIHKVIYEEPNLNNLEHLQRDLRNLISLLLHKQTNNRPGSAAMLVHYIRRLPINIQIQQVSEQTTVIAEKQIRNQTSQVAENNRKVDINKTNIVFSFFEKHVTKDNLKWWVIILWMIGVLCLLYLGILGVIVLFLSSYLIGKLFVSLK